MINKVVNVVDVVWLNHQKALKRGKYNDQPSWSIHLIKPRSILISLLTRVPVYVPTPSEFGEENGLHSRTAAGNQDWNQASNSWVRHICASRVSQWIQQYFFVLREVWWQMITDLELNVIELFYQVIFISSSFKTPPRDSFSYSLNLLTVREEIVESNYFFLEI